MPCKTNLHFFRLCRIILNNNINVIVICMINQHKIGHYYALIIIINNDIHVMLWEGKVCVTFHFVSQMQI